MSSKRNKSQKSAGSQSAQQPGQSGGGRTNKNILSGTQLEMYCNKMVDIVSGSLYDETIWTYSFLKTINPESGQQNASSTFMWGELNRWKDEDRFCSPQQAGDCVFLAHKFQQSVTDADVKLVAVHILKHRKGDVILDSHVCPLLQFDFHPCTALLQAVGHPTPDKSSGVSGVVLFDVGLHKTSSTFVFDHQPTITAGGKEKFFFTKSCVVRVSYTNDPRDFDVADFELCPLADEKKWKIIRSSIMGRKDQIFKIKKFSANGSELASLSLDFPHTTIITCQGTDQSKVGFGAHKEVVKCWASFVGLDNDGASDLLNRIDFLVTHKSNVEILSGLHPDVPPSTVLSGVAAEENDNILENSEENSKSDH